MTTNLHNLETPPSSTEQSLVAEDVAGAAAGRVRGTSNRHALRARLSLLLGDVIAMAIITPLALIIEQWITGGPGLLENPSLILFTFAVLPIALIAQFAGRHRPGAQRASEYARVCQGITLFGFISVVALHAAGPNALDIHDGQIVAACLSAALAIPLARRVVRTHWLPRILRPERTLVVGAGLVGQRLALKLMADRPANIDLIGFVDSDPHPITSALSHIPVLGDEDHLLDIARRERAERVIITFSRYDAERLIEMIRWSNLHQIEITVVPRLFEVLPEANTELVNAGDIPLLNVRPNRPSRTALAVKRTIDIGVSVGSLIVLAPLFALIALVVKVDGGGPVFFRQRRAGRHDTSFNILKFRTMSIDAEARRHELVEKNEVDGPLFKIRHDPRVTRVGRFLRKTSLDELPQLINVLRGEMSLVGPRPFVIYEDENITGWGRRRLELRPGITGPWQAMGRNDIPFEEMIRLDHMYVTRWSLWWDFKILLLTVPSVLLRKGAS